MGLRLDIIIIIIRRIRIRIRIIHMCVCVVGMGGLLFSYGGFDHKNPPGSQQRERKPWIQKLQSDSKRSQIPSEIPSTFALGHSQQQICRPCAFGISHGAC